MTIVNKLLGVKVGEYGNTITLTLVNDAGTAVDISAFTTAKTVTLESPDHIKKVTCTGSFSGNNGTDGVITFAPASGDIDREGDWTGQVELEAASARALSDIFTISVERRLKAST